MPIRITGLNSGLDTEALVSELVSAYRVKTEKYTKAQTKLSWKQDAWKELNSKIKSFYTKIGNMRYDSAYSLRSATVSDTTKAKVTAGDGAINGSYAIQIKQTAKSGYLTGAQLDEKITAKSTLGELGITSGKITVTSGNKVTDIDVNATMKVSEFVEQLKKSGLNANYDEVNHRFFVASEGTGKDNDFSLVGTDANGMAALSAMGLSVQSAADTTTYKAWAVYAKNEDGNAYVTYDADGTMVFNGTYSAEKTSDAMKDILEQLGKDRTDVTNLPSQIAYAKAYKNVSGVSEKLNDSAKEEMLKKLTNESDLDKKYVGDDGTIYTMQDGKYIYKDADGNRVSKTSVELKEAGIELTDDDKASNVLKELQVEAGLATKKTETADDGSTTEIIEVDEEAAKAYKAAIKTVEDYEENAENADEVAAVKGAADIDVLVADLETEVTESQAYLDQYEFLNASGFTVDNLDSVVAKISNASSILDGTTTVANSAGAVRIEAQDAIIVVNGAEYKDSDNTFSVNGLTIEALAETDYTVNAAGEKVYSSINVNVSNNTQGMYDKIKDVLKEYNELINEMTKLYNADTAKGYEPLTDDEKAAMSESQIEKWEEKIKNSVLRRDDTLESLISGLTSSMMSSVTINGKSYSMSSFGIMTLGSLNAEENEENALHINGDKDDEYTSGNADKLMAALAEDPDTIMDFFQQISEKVYNKINVKMRSTTMSSFNMVYNDKEMAREYSDYTKTISKWEEKLMDIEDSYFKKFAAMESALAEMQAQQSALAGLFGV